LSSGIKVVLFLLTISALLGFTQVPNSIQYAYGAGCAPEDVQHWNQIQFTFGNGNLVSDTEPELDENTRYDVWIQRDGNGISIPNQVVAEHLTNLGYVMTNGNPPQPQFFTIPTDLIQYSSFCNNFGLAQMVGGMFIQPDSTTLLLAYGIANAIWIAPIGIGIGLGIYLVKRRF